MHLHIKIPLVQVLEKKKKKQFLGGTFISDFERPLCLLRQLYRTQCQNFQSGKSTQGAEVHFWIISIENPVTCVHRAGNH